MHVQLSEGFITVMSTWPSNTVRWNLHDASYSKTSLCRSTDDNGYIKADDVIIQLINRQHTELPFLSRGCESADLEGGEGGGSKPDTLSRFSCTYS